MSPRWKCLTPLFNLPKATTEFRFRLAGGPQLVSTIQPVSWLYTSAFVTGCLQMRVLPIVFMLGGGDGRGLKKLRSEIRDSIVTAPLVPVNVGVTLG